MEETKRILNTDELLKWRDEFPILKKSTYLISNSLGAMPKSVYKRMHEYADTWANLVTGIRIAPHFYNTNEEKDILFDAIKKITK